jgi:hypothetical protein
MHATLPLIAWSVQRDAHYKTDPGFAVVNPNGFVAVHELIDPGGETKTGNV